MAQPTSQLARALPAATGLEEESDDEDLQFNIQDFSTHIPVGSEVTIPKVEDNNPYLTAGGPISAVVDTPEPGAPAPNSPGPQPMGGGGLDLLSIGTSGQLPPLFVPSYYFPLTQHIQQLQQQNQLQQQIIRQQQQQAQQAQQQLRQLHDLQFAQQQQQLAQLQHEQVQRERARIDPLQQLREEHLRPPPPILQPPTSSSPTPGCQPTSTLHQVHSVGPAAVGSQLPPVASSQLWNFSLMSADPYLNPLGSNDSAMAALQTYYQTQLAAASLQLAEKAAKLSVPGIHATGTISPAQVSPIASPVPHPSSSLPEMTSISTATTSTTTTATTTTNTGKRINNKSNNKSSTTTTTHITAIPSFDDSFGISVARSTLPATLSRESLLPHPDMDALSSHHAMPVVDVKKEEPDDDEPARCEWAGCKTVFAGTRQLADHVRKVHCRADNNEEYICRWSTCKRQLKPFPIPQQFLRHMQTHTREKPYQCKHPGCGQTFTQANVLAAHTRTHTGEKPYSCTVAGCGKRFAYANCLLAHTRSHTGEKPRVCKVCGKGFSGLSNLTAHMRTHTGERPYECKHEGCGKSFTTSSDLVRHTRIHTGQKPFACKVADCNKRFTTSSQLNNHLRTHTGERPYPCKTPGCDKRFADLTTLRRHEQSHERKRRVDDTDIKPDSTDGIDVAPRLNGQDSASKRAKTGLDHTSTAMYPFNLQDPFSG